MTAIHPNDALSLVLADLPPPAQEILPLDKACGRFLAKKVYAKIDQPPFDKSAMDGYAHCAVGPGLSGSWRVVSVIAAGDSPGKPLGTEECARIMTGAPIPAGAYAVQRREYAREDSGSVWFTRTESCDNIIRQGENQKSGDLLLSPRRLKPQDIGLLASSGYSTVPVTRKVSVGIVSTGDELTESGATLAAGKIYDSNGPQIAAQAAELGCDAKLFGIVRDNLTTLSDIIGRTIAEYDVTILSGAVSLGDFDYVPQTLEALGVKELFHGLKMRPGKPTYYGRIGEKSVFGLPGNPVSTFVNFEILIKPHLLKRSGSNENPTELVLPLAAPLTRKGDDRVEYLPAKLESKPTRVRQLAYRGSSMLSALADADCLIRIDIGVESLQEGDPVHVRLIRP
ncbi:MAG: gephyrin-like molybdotransferase Glp [Treponemataceae bacterium]